MKNTFTSKILWPLSSGLRYALIALLSFFGARYFTLHVLDTLHYAPIGALWAMITGMVVMADTFGSTVEKARLQLLGGLVGAIAGFIYLSIFPFGLAGMAIIIGLVVMVCQATTRLSGYSLGAAMNTGVILVFSSLNPELSPLMNSGLRLIEMAIGCGIAIFVVLLLPGKTGPTE